MTGLLYIQEAIVSGYSKHPCPIFHRATLVMVRWRIQPQQVRLRDQHNGLNWLAFVDPIS